MLHVIKIDRYIYSLESAVKQEKKLLIRKHLTKFIV